jgi:hypothetical protein
MEHMIILIPCKNCNGLLRVRYERSLTKLRCPSCGKPWNITRIMSDDESNQEDSIALFRIEERQVLYTKRSLLRFFTIIVFILVLSFLFFSGSYLAFNYRSSFFGTITFSAVFSVFILIVSFLSFNICKNISLRLAEFFYNIPPPIKYTYSFIVPSKYDLDKIATPFCKYENTDSLHFVETRCRMLLDKYLKIIESNKEDTEAAGAIEAIEEIVDYVGILRKKMKQKDNG